MTDEASRQELALYYTAWTWPDESLEWMKSLLLFFDGLAWLLPAKHCTDLLEADPVLAQPLWTAGLLRNFEPESWMTGPIAQEVRSAAEIVALQRRQAMTGVTAINATAAAASISLGHVISPVEDATGMIIRQLKRAGVVTRRRRDLGIDMVDMNRDVQQTVLTVAALGARAAINDIDIQLVTDDNDPAATAFTRAMATLQPLASSSEQEYHLGRILSSDMRNVSVDLTNVPLDEVLDYRSRHGADYRAYARHLREFVTVMAAADGKRERRRLANERVEEINDYAATLRRARRSFIRPAGAFTMSALGSAWTLKQGDPAGAILAALAAAAGLTKPAPPASAFTYLFNLRG